MLMLVQIFKNEPVMQFHVQSSLTNLETGALLLLLLSSEKIGTKFL
jgi:uncharacterized membrane protein